MSVEDRPDLELWFPGPNGRFYQGNDVGNVVLMLPAALASKAAGRPYEPGGVPDRATRVAVSATIAVVVVVGLLALFGALRLLVGRGQLALSLTLLFVVGTSFGAYAKTAYDVVGRRAARASSCGCSSKSCNGPRRHAATSSSLRPLSPSPVCSARATDRFSLSV